MTTQDLRDWMVADMPPRAKVALWRGSITALLLFHIFWACGWVPGMPGFALAAHAEDTNSEVRQLRIELLERDLLDAHALRCAADDRELRRLYSQRVQMRLRKYQEIVGTPYPLEPCPRTRGDSGGLT